MDKRSEKRVQIKVGCWIVEVDGLSCCHTFDISANGVSLRTDDPLPVGSRVNLQFFTPRSARPVTVSAEVIWNRLEPESAMGLCFNNIDEKTTGLVGEFVRMLAERRRD
jgi:hypothetical protein